MTVMITKNRIVTIGKLAFPVTIAQSSTLVMSLIDLAMVGRLGNQATAALGLSVFSNTLVLAFVAGMAPAVQGIVARRRGQASTEARCRPLNAGLLIAAMVGIPLTVICYLSTPLFFSLISSDSEVTRIGVPCLRTLYLALTAGGMNYAFSGYWTGMEKTRIYMLVVLATQCLNAFLDYTLIFGHFGAPALGATGAAIATASALYTGTLINFAIAYFRFPKDGIVSARPDRALLAHIAKLALPATLQSFFFSASYVVFLWLVGKVGTVELAAANVLVRISLVLLIVATSLGMASATLVSKTAGEGDLQGAAQWGWDSGKLGVIGITLLALPLLLFPRFFLSIFLSDPQAISIAIIPLRLVAATAGIGSLISIFAYTLYSVGDGNRVAITSFGMQWILFLPAVWLVGPYSHHGLLQIWLVQMAYGALATVFITALWADRRWMKIKI